MPITEEGATALVRVRGLGLVALNDEHKPDGRFEEAMIRSGNHKLEVVVTGPRSDDDGTEVEHFRGCLPVRAGIEISIKGVEEPLVKGFKPFEATNFDRRDPSICDKNDFRWVFDLTDLYGQKLEKNPLSYDNLKPEITAVYIENADLYADIPEGILLDNQPFFMKKTGPNEPPIAYGFLSEYICARLISKRIEIEITVPGIEKFVLHRKHFEGVSYTVNISNLDTSERATFEELDVVYKFLKPATATPIQLNGWAKVLSEGGVGTDGWDYCHGGKGGGTKLSDYI
ncbi:MAG: hypothetical protein JNL64_14630 [Blastocatellia bacterium]|nr:hypothetical protein [Blastocatellia bacterium]